MRNLYLKGDENELRHMLTDGQWQNLDEAKKSLHVEDENLEDIDFKEVIPMYKNFSGHPSFEGAQQGKSLGEALKRIQSQSPNETMQQLHGEHWLHAEITYF